MGSQEASHLEELVPRHTHQWQGDQACPRLDSGLKDKTAETANKTMQTPLSRLGPPILWWEADVPSVEGGGKRSEFPTRSKHEGI